MKFIILIERFLFALMIVSALFGLLSLPASANAAFSGNVIDVNSEYSDGTIGSPYEDLALWYAWINCNGTQVVYLAYESYVLRPPVVTFLGQHYLTEGNQEVFVGNTLAVLEVYNDTNGNGIPDSNRTRDFGPGMASGYSEILFDFGVNSSASFEATPIKKTVQEPVHYTWGVRYNDIDGFLLTENQGEIVKVVLDRLEFSYDFYVEGNRSYLKTDFGIGKLLEVQPRLDFKVDLEGLSLSLLYGTTILSTKEYATTIDGMAYNSATAETSTNPAALGEIRIENVTAYEFCFGQNYTILSGEQQKSVQSLSAAAASSTWVWGGYQSVEGLLVHFENVLKDVFPRISSINQPISLDLGTSTYLYRICYPEWSGNVIEHDPVYVAHLALASIASTNFQWVFFIVAIGGSILFMGAILYWKKRKKV